MSTRLLTVELGSRSYPIRIGSQLLANPDSYAQLLGRKVLLLTDSNVARHYLEPVRGALNIDGPRTLVVEAGEPQKNWDQAARVLDWMLAERLGRDGALVALGGGVVGDLGGFCAAIYQRGIDFVQVPTTLLAQVDSSVGGKTGVNHARGKNLIGAFHQPVAVIADTDTLATLPPRELRAGLAEVIKYGLLDDFTLFAWLEKNLERILALDAQFVGEAVERCCAIKARIVGLDEREHMAGGPRALLNLGHTFGHAIETFTGYTQWLHGEAVGTGMCMAADLSHRMGWIRATELERATRLIGLAGLPTAAPPGMTPGQFRELMVLDKKSRSGQLRLVLLRAIGEAVLTSDIDDAALQATLEKFCTPAPAAPGPAAGA